MSRYLVCNHSVSDEELLICNSKDELNGLLIQLNIDAQEEYCEENDLDMEDFDDDNPCLVGAETSIYRISDVLEAISNANTIDSASKENYKQMLKENETIEADNDLLDILDDVDEYYDV